MRLPTLNKGTKILLAILGAVLLAIAGFKIVESRLFRSKPAPSQAPKVTSVKQEDFGTLLNQAEEFFHQNQLTQSLELLQKALKLDPNSARVHNDIGLILIEQSRLEESEKYLKLAKKITDSDPKQIVRKKQLDNYIKTRKTGL